MKFIILLTAILLSACSGATDSRSQGPNDNSAQIASQSISDNDTSKEDLIPITDWFDEQFAIDAIESYKYQSHISVQLYFKPVDGKKDLWEHLPTFDDMASDKLKYHSSTSFFSPYLEDDILDALDAAKFSKSTVIDNSRYVQLLMPDFGKIEHLKLPDGQEDMLRLSFKLLDYGDVIKGSVYFRKNSPNNSGGNSIKYSRDLQPIGLPGAFFLERRNVGEFLAPAYFGPEGIIFAIKEPALVNLQSVEKR